MKKEEIKPLLEIQEIDEEVERVERRLRSIEEDRKKLLEELSRLMGELEGLESERKNLLSKRKELREEIEREEMMLSKTEERIGMVKRDSEYKALLRERSKHEDNILKKSYELDEVEKGLAELEKRIGEKRPRLEGRIKEIEEELEELELEKSSALKKLESLRAEREAVARKVSSEVLTFYEEAKKRFGNRVIVRVEEGACGGCGIRIPNVLFSKLIKEDSVEVCPSCGRYIYYRL